MKLCKNSNSHQENPTVSCDAISGPNYQEIATEVYELYLYTPRVLATHSPVGQQTRASPV